MSKRVIEAITLANVMFCEASGDGSAGMLAVADVVLNRVKSPKFPNTIGEVVHQKHQFECIEKGKYEGLGMHDPDWKKAYDLAFRKLEGRAPRMTHATHYHANWMKQYPSWANKLSFLDRFYAMK